ncbi:hypothetical protein GGR57DRAFT_514380 [Xylariaceae sp. FL1272]|nr:hypothetical protein GGR57DRAFT_514380 [Xylariaceae sp. FL1272]
MDPIDPATGQPLSADAIQRVLFIINTVHVYNIPPMTPGKGHLAASSHVCYIGSLQKSACVDGPEYQPLTRDSYSGPQMEINARSLLLDCAFWRQLSHEQSDEDKVAAAVVLEDPKNGQLFAAAPYTTTAVVEPVSDSSRFFALRVQDEAGRKATLGIGFEERSDAFDFSVALQEAQKALGWVQGGQPGQKPATETKDSAEKRDLSLKEGETITVNLPGRFSRSRPQLAQESSGAGLASFSLPPPPSSSASSKGGGILPPPPSAPLTSSRAKRLSAQNLGFDDGKFGEFA